MKLVTKTLLLFFLIAFSQSRSLRVLRQGATQGSTTAPVVPPSNSGAAGNKAGSSGAAMSKAPFNPDSAISLAKDIAPLIINKGTMDDNTFGSTIGSCIGQLRNKKNAAMTALSTYWTDMNKAQASNSYNNNSFVTNIAGQLAGVSVQAPNGVNTNCGTFFTSVKDPNPVTAVNAILSKSDYFGGFASTNTPQKPFVTGIVGTRRHLLPNGVFHQLNGLPAPK